LRCERGGGFPNPSEDGGFDEFREFAATCRCNAATCTRNRSITAACCATNARSAVSSSASPDDTTRSSPPHAPTSISHAEPLNSHGSRNKGVAGLDALVWDEETGWRYGTFVSGQPGIRTILAKATPLGAGLLPTGDLIAERITSGTRAKLQKLRDHNDLHDGFERQLQQAGSIPAGV
jgi:hypothetical protein